MSDESPPYRFRTGIAAGTIQTEDGPIPIEGGRVEVDDLELAHELARRQGHLTPLAPLPALTAESMAEAEAEPEGDTTDKPVVTSDDVRMTAASTTTEAANEAVDNEADADADADADAEDVDLDALSYADLQALAKDHDIAANQSTEELQAALAEVL